MIQANFIVNFSDFWYQHIYDLKQQTLGRSLFFKEALQLGAEPVNISLLVASLF